MAKQLITLVISTEHAEQKIDTFVESLKDLSPVLKEFSQYKTGKLAELFASGGNGKWPERAERSEQRGWKRAIGMAERAPQALRKKLTREYGRALYRTKAGKGKTNAVVRRGFVLAEFERQVEAGALNVEGFEHEDRRLQKSVRGLAARLGRAHQRAQKSGQILGQIPQTVKAEIKNGTLTIGSSWDSPAPKALQEGGKVGNDAELPARPWLYWDDADAEYFKILLRARGLLAWG